MGTIEGKCRCRKEKNFFMAYTESHIYIAVLVFYCRIQNCNKQWLKIIHKEFIAPVC